MNISEKVKSLSPKELKQAASLLKKKRSAIIPMLGTLRKDGTPRRFVYQETVTDEVSTTHIYLDKVANKLISNTYTKAQETGNMVRNRSFNKL